MIDDLELLNRFAKTGDETAFSELVARRLDFVYSAALRQLHGDEHAAGEAAQSVFIDLARKAGSLRRGVVLTAWLHEAARFAACKLVRSEQRRRTREQKAAAMYNDSPNDAQPSEADMQDLSPVLDEAIGELDTIDRNAVLLRFFDRKDFRAIGIALSLTEDTAQKRVSRALEKLRGKLTSKGISISGAALAAILGGTLNSAPVGLALSIASASIAAAGKNLAGATLLQILALPKLQTAVAVVLAAVTAGWFAQHQSLEKLRQENQSLQLRVDALALENASLSRTVNQAKSAQTISREQFAELLKLRGEIGLLQKERDDLKNLQKSKPVALLNAIAFKGNSLFTDAQLSAALISKVGEPLDRSKIDQDIRNLYKLYRDNGYGVQLRAAEERDLAGGNTLTFVVANESTPVAGFEGQLRDLGASTPERAASSLIWAVRTGERARLADLLELPKSVSPEDAPKHYDFFANQLSNVFGKLQFTTLNGTRSLPDGTLRLNMEYRALDTGKTNPFPFILRQHDAAWKVVVEGEVPRTLPLPGLQSPSP